MAKYTVEHKCGCKAEVQLFGGHAERDRRIEAMEVERCIVCRADEARKPAKVGGDPSALKYGTDHAADLFPVDFPGLEGSDKQVAYAFDLRQGFSGKHEDLLILAKHPRAHDAKFWIADAKEELRKAKVQAARERNAQKLLDEVTEKGTFDGVVNGVCLRTQAAAIAWAIKQAGTPRAHHDGDAEAYFVGAPYWLFEEGQEYPTPITTPADLLAAAEAWDARKTEGRHV